MDGYMAPPLSRLSEVDDGFELSDVEKLQDDLERCKHEKEMIADQLNCFIILVRKALNGDPDALQHVNKIAATEGSFEDVQRQALTEAEDSPRVKLRAVKNWGILTASLLHQDYNTRMVQLREISQQRLSYRGQMLEKVQQQHINRFSTASLALRPKSGQSLPVKPKGPNITTTDLFGGTGDHGFQNEAMDALYNRTVSDHQTYKSSPKYNSEFKGSYDDPNRYTQKGLFNSAGMIKKSRPTSASSLKAADAKRARPKSAGVLPAQQTERPLKYETTRPVSSKTKRSERRTPENHSVKNSPPPSDKPKKNPIEEFTDELGAMEDMEQQFRSTTVSLQKKIGIRPDGFIS